ncbi:hypothetical protein ACN38_g4638 [Penicillium nordicum]|uniref:BHLH domain-containing protein n=1 Tax=Penicillium nordicum TaxID=229535 RepID=A0A0M8P6C8_9EURO|nr:hypothetical protein ACN38_g4638 [Penicillium nordicum]
MNVLPTFLSLALFSVAYDAPSDNGAYTSNQNAHSAGVAQAGLEILTFIQCIVVAKKVWARSSLEAAFKLRERGGISILILFNHFTLIHATTANSDAHASRAEQSQSIANTEGDKSVRSLVNPHKARIRKQQKTLQILRNRLSIAYQNYPPQKSEVKLTIERAVGLLQEAAAYPVYSALCGQDG